MTQEEKISLVQQYLTALPPNTSINTYASTNFDLQETGMGGISGSAYTFGSTTIPNAFLEAIGVNSSNGIVNASIVSENFINNIPAYLTPLNKLTIVDIFNTAVKGKIADDESSLQNFRKLLLKKFLLGEMPYAISTALNPGNISEISVLNELLANPQNNQCDIYINAIFRILNRKASVGLDGTYNEQAVDPNNVEQTMLDAIQYIFVKILNIFLELLQQKKIESNIE